MFPLANLTQQKPFFVYFHR